MFKAYWSFIIVLIIRMFPNVSAVNRVHFFRTAIAKYNILPENSIYDKVIVII